VFVNLAVPGNRLFPARLLIHINVVIASGTKEHATFLMELSQ
jgi:hypothetical protein